MSEDLSLANYYGVLSEETADEIERLIEERREARSEHYRARVEQLRDALPE